MSPAEADIAGIFLEEVASAADGRMAPLMSAAAIREGFHLDGCNILHPSWHAGETTYQPDGGEGLPCQQGGETHWRPKAPQFSSGVETHARVVPSRRFARPPSGATLARTRACPFCPCGLREAVAWSQIRRATSNRRAGLALHRFAS